MASIPKSGMAKKSEPPKFDYKAARKKAAEAEVRKLKRMIKNTSEENTTDWEASLLVDVKSRLEEFGCAFADPEKGDISQPLSLLQGAKLREINKERKLREKIGMKKARALVFDKLRKQGKLRSRSMDDD